MKYHSFFELNNLSDESLYVSEIENAIDSLTTALSFLPRSDNMKWKWVAIALDHSLYCFCIASLVRHRDDVTQLAPKKEDNFRTIRFGDQPQRRSRIVPRSTGSGAYTIEWDDSSASANITPPARRKLIGFWTALARVQDSYYWMGRYAGTNPLVLSDDDWSAIEWLHNEVRNGLIHFVPTVTSIPIDELRSASSRVLSAINFLAFDSHAIHYTHRTESQERISKAVQDLADQLKP